MARPSAAALLALLGVGPDLVLAQAPPPGEWNDQRVLSLVARARDRRDEPVVDSLLRAYRADATGHIYFFLDQEQGGEPVLLRADQVALELYWAWPGRTKQVIRGMRSEEQFPIRDFAYYLDRYTVIQNGFGDEIRVGEGRDVADVIHPLAPGGATVYDYRLADSMTLRLPGRADELRVYEVQVRPRDFGSPAIVGSLFIERARGDLVRLAFTFTPSAYLDRRNERVEVVLENALWEDRYWLPREQRLLVRREIPELDLDVGTVIRAAIRVTDYDLDPEIPPGFFDGRGVIAAAGPEGLAGYDFDEGLYQGLDDVGLTPGAQPGTLDAVDVDAIAGRILRQRFLRGVPRLRFYAPDGSAVLRYDRAEGVVTGAGLALGVGERQLTAYGAWAWGPEMPIAEIALRPLPAADGRWSVEGYLHRPVDLGARPAAAGVLSSLAAAGFGEDYRDLYFESGIGLGVELTNRPGGLSLVATAERHRSPHLAASRAPFDEDALLPPVVPIEEGDQLALTLRGRSAGPTAWGGRGDIRFALEGGWFRDRPTRDGRWFGVADFELLRAWRGADMDWGIEARQTFRFTIDPRLQHGALLGGRNTLPGYDFHSLYAQNLILTDLEGWVTAVPRWLRLRGIGGAGWVGGRNGSAVPAFVGVGAAVLDGILRLDYAVPVGQRTGFDDVASPRAPATGIAPEGGAWILSIDPRLWPFL